MPTYLFTAPNTINGERAKTRKSNGNLDNFDIDIATRNFENSQEDSSDSKFERARSQRRNDQISAVDEL